MEMDDKVIEKFHQLYFEEFGEEISKEKACERYVSFMNLMRVVLRKTPDPDPDLDLLKKVHTLN